MVRMTPVGLWSGVDSTTVPNLCKNGLRKKMTSTRVEIVINTLTNNMDAAKDRDV